MASPLTIKFASLLVRTLAKPIANSIKNQAKQHPRFKAFCISIAQTYHKAESTIKANFLDYKSESAVRPLNDSKAVEMGANFISESIIFAVAALTIAGETYRQSRKTTARKNNIDETIEELSQLSNSQKLEIEGLQTEIDSLKGDLLALKEKINQESLQKLKKHDLEKGKWKWGFL